MEDSISSQFERLYKRGSSQEQSVIRPEHASGLSSSQSSYRILQEESISEPETSSQLSSHPSRQQSKIRTLIDQVIRTLVACDLEYVRVFIVTTDEVAPLKQKLEQKSNCVVEYEYTGFNNSKKAATKFLDFEIGKGKCELGAPILEEYCGHTCKRFSFKLLGEDGDKEIPQSPVCFSMEVEDVFSIRGRGTVVTGKILTGSLKVGDEVSIYGGSKVIKTMVTGIERRRYLLDHADAGDDVGVLLRGINHEDVRKGYILRKDK